MKRLWSPLSIISSAATRDQYRCLTDSQEHHCIIDEQSVRYANDLNINGPSCIEVPKWIEGRLGRYYLYFASHHGDHIRLAVSDEITGPWRVVEGGVFSLSEAEYCCDHIASPDAIVDEVSKRIVLFFHGVDRKTGSQRTFSTTSRNGLQFDSSYDTGAPFYLRVVRWRDRWIGISKGGMLHVARHLDGQFRRCHPSLPIYDDLANGPGHARHFSMLIEEDRLWIAFSRIADAPEHIRLGYIDLALPIEKWKITADVPLLFPKTPWEGGALPIVSSRAGGSICRENSLRDPYLFRTDEQNWLFYSGAGERCIGVTKLDDFAIHFGTSIAFRPWIAHLLRRPHRKVRPLLRPIRHWLRTRTQFAKLQLFLIRETFRIEQRRIYLMGCGRSGTWLLTSLMGVYEDTQVVASELPVSTFMSRESDARTLVIKRSAEAYQTAQYIPNSIFLLYIVRHPFDVLTSNNKTTQFRYHVSPERWLGELASLRRLMERGRKNMLVVRYEDLVSSPSAVLERISISTKTNIRAGSVLADKVNLPVEAVTAMHGLRSPDVNSVERYRSQPGAMDYLRHILPDLYPMLNWVGETFGYDVSLPDI